MTPFLESIDESLLCPSARARVLYADTDKMGIVYHASYLRYLELARVEFIRSTGLPYTRLESHGLALPLTDMAVRFISPARYDDRMTIQAGLSLLTQVRVHFQYAIVVHAGDREGGPGHDIRILTAETRHACVRVADARPERLPAEVYRVLQSCYTDRRSLER